MTRDQMHNTLRYVREQLADERGSDFSGVEALDMVIAELEQEPSGDLISRQLAIDTMAKLEQEDIDTYGCSIPEGFDGERAIEALKQLPSVKQEPCDDAISRQADNLCSSCTNIGCEFQSGIVRTKCAFYMPPHIESDNCGNYVVMQPVNPQEPKTGHWYSDCRNDYFICNQCKAEFERFSQGGYELIDDYNYCPNCGCRMVQEGSE